MGGVVIEGVLKRVGEGSGGEYTAIGSCSYDDVIDGSAIKCLGVGLDE